MDKKELEKMYNYLPVVVSQAEMYSLNSKNKTITQSVLKDIRNFFELLQSTITLAKIPKPVEIESDKHGNIIFSWWKVSDAHKLFLDIFEISFTGYEMIRYSGLFESTENVKIDGEIEIKKPINKEILECLNFFYREFKK